MIEKLSFSSLEAFVTDRQKFYRRYILKERTPSSQPLVVGDGVHQCIERYLHDRATFDMEKELVRLWTNIQERQEKGEVDTHLVEEEVVEEIMTGVTHALTWITEMLPSQPMHIEKKIETPLLSPSGYLIPHVVGVVDMVDADGYIYDWKCVSKFSSDETISPKYILQATCYAILAETTKLVEHPVNKVFFVEIKKTHPKTKKKDEAPDVVRVHTIDILPLYRDALLTMFERMHRELMGENMLKQGLVIPNVFGMFGNEDPWQYYLKNFISPTEETLW